MSEALQYLTDEAGKKTAVVLPIPDYEKLLEDLDDLAAIAARREGPTVPHGQFQAGLGRDGPLLPSVAAVGEEGPSEAAAPRGPSGSGRCRLVCGKTVFAR